MRDRKREDKATRWNDTWCLPSQVPRRAYKPWYTATGKPVHVDL